MSASHAPPQVHALQVLAHACDVALGSSAGLRVPDRVGLEKRTGPEFTVGSLLGGLRPIALLSLPPSTSTSLPPPAGVVIRAVIPAPLGRALGEGGRRRLRGISPGSPRSSRSSSGSGPTAVVSGSGETSTQ